MNKKTLRLASGVLAATLAAFTLSSVSAGAETTHPDDDFSTTIVNGQPADEEQFHYMVALTGESDNPLNRCGGALIADDVVLTAAHCLETTVDPVVRHGSTDLTSDDMTVYEIADSYVAEDYDSPERANDWALLKLTEPVAETKLLLLPEDDSFDDGPMLTVAGWGLTETGERSDLLMYAEVPYVDDETCATNYGDTLHSESMLCAGYMEAGGVDACTNDDGGPLVNYDENDQAVSVGIFSWNRACAAPGEPGVYAQTSYFLDEIEAAMAAW